METLTVYNSSRRSWIAVLLGVVLIGAALDLLLWDWLVAGLAEKIYQGEEVLEDRERVWAGMLLATGAILLVWGVVSAARHRPVLTVGPEGLSLCLRGPFRPLDLLAWESISEVFSQPVADDGSLLSSLTVVLQPTDQELDLPARPWGARWVGKRVLRVLASDWLVRAEVVETVSNHYFDRISEKEMAADSS